MVTNQDMDWLKLCKGWQQKQADYLSAQKRLDDTMSAYLNAEGPPPTRRALKIVDDLWEQMMETRVTMNEFIEAHATAHSDKHNLPRHE